MTEKLSQLTTKNQISSRKKSNTHKHTYLRQSKSQSKSQSKRNTSLRLNKVQPTNVMLKIDNAIIRRSQCSSENYCLVSVYSYFVFILNWKQNLRHVLHLTPTILIKSKRCDSYYIRSQNQNQLVAFFLSCGTVLRNA